MMECAIRECREQAIGMMPVRITQRGSTPCDIAGIAICEGHARELLQGATLTEGVLKGTVCVPEEHRHRLLQQLEVLR